MAAINQRITDQVAGDAWTISRVFDSDLPDGVTFIKAKMIIKLRANDDDAAAIWDGEITTTNSPDGIILQDTTPAVEVEFDIPKGITGQLKPGTEYPYDIVFETTENQPVTAEVGVIVPVRGVRKIKP